MARPDSIDEVPLTAFVLVIPQTGEALLKDEQVGAIYGYGTSSVYARVKSDPDFPQPVRLDGGRFTRWKLSDIRSHIARMDTRTPKPGPAARDSSKDRVVEL